MLFAYIWFFFLFKQKTAYEMLISDWSSDVCSSDLDELGPIQILVNNAGVAATAPFLDMTEQDWAQVLDTNLTGVWRVGQAVARRMAPLGRGSIINISSMALLQRLAAVRGRLSLCARSEERRVGKEGVSKCRT